jgi:hypothetical protein
LDVLTYIEERKLDKLQALEQANGEHARRVLAVYLSIIQLAVGGSGSRLSGGMYLAAGGVVQLMESLLPGIVELVNKKTQRLAKRRGGDRVWHLKWGDESGCASCCREE